MTSQRAFNPQEPKQGSVHFWLTHALVDGHSALTMHSGLQFGGAPMYPDKQEQTAWPFCCLHWLLGPQGDGWQGSSGSFGSSVIIKCVVRQSMSFALWFLLLILTLRDRSTVCKRISSELFWTRAHRDMVDYIATCTLSTRSRTWIATFVSNASLVSWTFIVYNALRSAIFVRISNVLW